VFEFDVLVQTVFRAGESTHSFYRRNSGDI
jgi:hypothetical protein